MHTARSTAESLVADLRTIFGARLRSVVVYGAASAAAHGDEPVACVALVDSLTAVDLEACARSAGAWQRRGLATPLVLPESEFRRSLDAFPLEYGEIIRAHTNVYGHDPFEGVAVQPEDLRRACETQVKSHLVHLREGFIEAGNKPQGVAALITSSAPA